VSMFISITSNFPDRIFRAFRIHKSSFDCPSVKPFADSYCGPALNGL
jgi:hypothetical protein